MITDFPKALTAWIKNFVLEIRSALWFRPAIYSLVGAILAAVISLFDAQGYVPAVSFVSEQSVVDLLRFMASGVLTVITVTVSVLMLVLSIAAGNASPRALPEIMADPVTQNTLGTFMAALVFSIGGMIALEVRDLSPGAISAVCVVALVLLAAVLKYLIQWIDHVASAIKINRIVERIYTNTANVLKSFLATREKDEDCVDYDRPDDLKRRDVVLPAVGFIKFIDMGELDTHAKKIDAWIEIDAHEGDFTNGVNALMRVYSHDDVDDETCKEICQLIVIGPERTATGDPLLGFELLAEVASRALSPGINDPQTAIVTIRYLGALLGQASIVSKKDFPKRQTKNGRVRCKRQTFEDMLKRAVRAVAKDARDKPEVLIMIAEMLQDLSKTVHRDHAAVFEPELQTLEACAESDAMLESDRDAVMTIVDDIRKRLNAD